jgi:hypothetical protein
MKAAVILRLLRLGLRYQGDIVRLRLLRHRLLLLPVHLGLAFPHTFACATSASPSTLQPGDSLARDELAMGIDSRSVNS